MSTNVGGKLFIVLITVTMLISYSPLMVNGQVSEASSIPSGNLYIQSGTTFIINESTIDPLTGTSGMFGMSGSLFVNSSATLIIDNATLYFRQDIFHHYRMYVNGTLIINNGVIETSYNAVQPYLPLNISFYNANVRTDGAHFLFPGHIYFYKSTLVLKNTYFNSLSGIPAQLNVGNVSDSSPTPSFYESTGYFDNVFFENMFNPTPIVLKYFVNSSASKIPVNMTAGNPPVYEYSTLKNSNYPGQTVISGINVFLEYKSTMNATVTLYLNGKNLPLLNGNLTSTRGNLTSENFTLSGKIPPLKLSQFYNNELYAIIKGTSKSGYVNISKMYFILSTNDTFNYYGGNSSFYFYMYNSNIFGMNVFIDSNFNNDTLFNGLEMNIKNVILLQSNSNMYIVNLTISGSLTGTNMMTDNAPFLVDSTSTVNLFRYAEINITNPQGYPVSGLKINAQESWPSNYPNAQQYDTLASNLNSEFQNILVSENFIPSSFNYTNQGVSIIPLLTDIFTNYTSPNTMIFGHYELQMAGGFTRNITLDSYPSMNSSSNTAKVNITFASPFIYYFINTLPRFIYGNNIGIGITASSYENSIAGTFVLMNNSLELAASSIYLKANTTTNVLLTFADNLKPGKYNLSIEFMSSQVYSSNPSLKFNVTSYSNVNIVTSAALIPRYEMNGSMISGYGAKLNVTIKNLGNQSSGIVGVVTNYTIPGEKTYVFPSDVVVNGKSSINESYSISAINVSTPSSINVKVSATTAKGVIPYSIAGENTSENFSVIPAPAVNVVSVSFNQTYLYGLGINGIVLLESNEAVYNVNVSVQINGKYLYYNINSINGFLNLPVTIPQAYSLIGNNVVNVTVNNLKEPYLIVGFPKSTSFFVEKNYQFEVQNVNFILNSNITDTLNGTMFFTIINPGNFSALSVPVEIMYNGVQVYESNETINSPVQISLNLAYSSTMNFEIVVNYNYEYPTSYTYSPYMYFNSSLKYPYFYTTYSLPTQVVNGSAIKGYFSINSLANYYSNDTSIYYYLGNNLLFQKNLGNITQGFSTTLNINVSTLKIKDLMNNNTVMTYNSYFLIKDSETNPFGIIINTGQLSIIERPNFLVTNTSIMVNNHNTTIIYAGEAFKVQFNITNDGGTSSAGSIPFVILGRNNSSTLIIYKGFTNNSIYPGQTITISTPTIIVKTPFSGLLYVYYNYNDTIYTKLPGAQNVSIPFRIVNPKLVFIITPLFSEVTAGSVETLEIKAINSNNSQPWVTNITVTVTQGSKIVERVNGKTNSFGVFTFSFKVVNAGNYNVIVNYQGLTGVQYQSYSNIFSVKQAPIVIPSFVFPVVIVVVILVGFMFALRHLRNKSTGLVQCSVCGAILPEDSTKCPRCGTEFERERVKCSECGSWIPEDSKYCPNCGALFIGKQSPEYSGISKLKVQYEQFLDTYRQKAKAVLGDKMNELEFQSWWRNNPDYKSFKQWITERGLSPEEVENEKGGNVDLKVAKKKGLFKRNKK